MMRKILILLILSSTSLVAQSYARGYNSEKLEQVRDLLDPICKGDVDYCDCLFNKVVTEIPFKKLRNPESIGLLTEIVNSCQREFANYAFDPDKPAELSISSNVTLNPRSRGVLFDRDTIRIPFVMKNYGLGKAYDPSIYTELSTKQSSEIDFDKKTVISDLSPADEYNGELFFWCRNLVPGDTLTLKIYGEDASGAVTDNIDTYNFYTPLTKSKELAFYPADPQLISKGTYKVNFEISNTGSVPLYYLDYEFGLNDKLYANTSLDYIDRITSNQFIFNPEQFDIEYLALGNVMYPGEMVRGEFIFSVPGAFSDPDIELSVLFSDDERWTKKGNHVLISDYQGFQQRVNSQSIALNTSIFSSYSDVDDVSKIADVDPSCYAIIIGNEHYQSDDIYSVKFANRDAQVFQKYCQNLLGVPAENIEMVLDGSIGQMNEALRKISNIVEQERNAVVYFYYAGHGWPSEDSEPLLIPSDISVNQLENAIKLNEVTKLFRRNPDTELIAFVDACYASESFAKQTRSVIIEIKEPLVSGNQILFSAVSQNQEANSHEESRHGVFTYYLLESLKDKGGKLTMSELDERLRLNVTKYVNSKSGLKNQVPTVHVPVDKQDKIEKWKIAD